MATTKDRPFRERAYALKAEIYEAMAKDASGEHVDSEHVKDLTQRAEDLVAEKQTLPVLPDDARSLMEITHTGETFQQQSGRACKIM